MNNAPHQRGGETKALGLLGGTFDPVHFGHLRAAIECADAFQLSEVRLMPCNPVHRQQPVATNEQREAMLSMAVQEPSRLALERFELGQLNPTYTIDTLRHVRSLIGRDRPLYFIVGSDAFNAIETWKEWQALFDEANFIVMHRPASPLLIQHEDIRSRVASFDGNHFANGNVYPFAISGLDISSTKIRDLVHSGFSIEFLLPNAVEAYIKQQRLYR